VGTSGGLIALALLPLGIPLVWLALTQFGGQPGEFSFAMPVAIGLGVSGLCLGLANCSRWSVGRRAAGMIVLMLLAVLCTAVLYSAKKTWIEQVRKVFGRGEIGWFKFEPNAADLRANDLSFEVRFPGAPATIDSPVEGLALKGAKFMERGRGWEEEFVVAHGRLPNEMAGWQANDVWFRKVRDAIVTSTKGTLKSETNRDYQTYPARDYVIEFDDANGNQRKRIVRIVKVSSQLFYLAAEGPFVNMDTPDVQMFLRSFKIVPQRPKAR
jgi:hypothetical protein